MCCTLSLRARPSLHLNLAAAVRSSTDGAATDVSEVHVSPRLPRLDQDGDAVNKGARMEQKQKGGGGGSAY